MMEFKQQSSRPIVISVLLGCLLIAAAIVFAGVWIAQASDSNDASPTILSTSAPATTTLITPITPTAEQFKSESGTYNYAAVASESKECSQIGNDILARYRGHAVDAMVATLLCNGVEHPQSSGIGGGAFFVIYDKNQGVTAVNARETAPAAATQNMYVGEDKRQNSTLGGKAIAIPGELKGLIEVHAKYGRVPWKTLVQPSINLLKNGWKLSKSVYDNLQEQKERPGFDDYLDRDGNIVPVGTIIKNPKLAATMQIIADDPMSFYNGTMAEDIVKDIQERGGIITVDDLKNYTLDWTNATMMPLPGDKILYSMPPPGSGVIISYILSILSGYGFTADSVANDQKTILTYHRIVEAMKFAYGKRSSLGDAAFVDIQELVKNLTSRAYGEATRQKITDDKTQPFEYYDSDFYSEDTPGTNHLSVIDAEGNAVAVTSTVNLHFGSKVIGNLTGIVFNNEMDDFSTPNLTNSFGFLPSKSNFIEPGKRPQSSMSPSIVFDNTLNKVVMVAGAAGGSRITSSSALILMDVLWFNMTMVKAMDLPRIHHQLLPNTVYVETAVPMNLRSGLETKGHTITVSQTAMSISHAIALRNGKVEAASDYRKGGAPAGY